MGSDTAAARIDIDSAEAEIRSCYESGYSFTPLDGKAPIRKAWTSEPKLPIDDIIKHLRSGGNVGLRTGRASGIYVIDIDSEDALLPDLPDTVMVQTSSGHRHLYYAHPNGAVLGNTAGRIANGVDTRGDGGQVVFPWSIHPETKTIYEFIPGHAPWDIDLAPLPAWVIEKVKEEKVEKKAAALQSPMALPSPAPATVSIKRGTAYARVALKNEVAKILSSAEGIRNDTLNIAAFSMGQLISGGQIDQATVENELFGAARMVGLAEKEIVATIESGFKAGSASPRLPSDTNRRIHPILAPPVTDQSPDPETLASVLIPGTHYTDEGSIEVSTSEFSITAMNKIPEDQLYEMSNIPGEIVGEPGDRRWVQISTDRMRLLVDRCVRLSQMVKLKPDPAHPGGPTTSISYRPCTRDFANLILAQAENHPNCRHVNMVVNYPVYVKGWTLTQPGWNAGIFYDEPEDLSDIEPIVDHETIHATYNELVTDFPFADAASRQNFLGLMLTPIITPAIEGNRPLHLITATIERTGKSKLAEEVFGGIITGSRAPAMQLTGNDEERDKRILALLLHGKTLLHLDNLPYKLNSAALASLLTADVYQGRMLGSTKILSLKNTLTIVATGNNTSCSSEISKRVVPIVLEPNTPHPENRTNFQHPNLGEHVKRNRKKLLAVLLGMIQNWIDHGQPMHQRPMGGFESWASVIGGVLKVNAFHDWRGNEVSWRSESDVESEAREAFVAAWWTIHRERRVTAKDLVDIATTNDLIHEVSSKRDSSSQNIAMGLWLKRHLRTPIGHYQITMTKYCGNKSYMLRMMHDGD